MSAHRHEEARSAPLRRGLLLLLRLSLRRPGRLLSRSLQQSLDLCRGHDVLVAAEGVCLGAGLVPELIDIDHRTEGDQPCQPQPQQYKNQKKKKKRKSNGTAAGTPTTANDQHHTNRRMR